MTRSPKAKKRTARGQGSEARNLRDAFNHGKRQAREVLERREARAPEEAPTGVNGLLIAEGDSWFDYPFNSVLEELEQRFNYRIESVSHKGDTVEEMAYDAGQLSKLAGLFEKLGQQAIVPRAILLSGGGNDVAGDEFSVLLNHKQSGLKALNDEIVSGVLRGRLQFAMVSLISAVTELSRRFFGRAVPVLMHGYDYPVPDGRGYVGGFWVLPGPWLEPGFRRKGYADLGERCRVMVDLINRFNDVVEGLRRQSGLEHVVYVNLRRTLSNGLEGSKYRKSWANELHPTDAGFQIVAGEFHKAVSKLPMP